MASRTPSLPDSIYIFLLFSEKLNIPGSYIYDIGHSPLDGKLRAVPKSNGDRWKLITFASQGFDFCVLFARVSYTYIW